MSLKYKQVKTVGNDLVSVAWTLTTSDVFMRIIKFIDALIMFGLYFGLNVLQWGLFHLNSQGTFLLEEY